MNPKKMLSKEIAQTVKGHISEEAVSESVNQFFRHGNTFLLFELMRLKNEVKNLREDLQQHQQTNKATLQELIIP